VRLTQDLPYSRPQTPDKPATVQLGWIGLGAMGHLIARNLANHRAAHLEQQPPLLVWNRSKAIARSPSRRPSWTSRRPVTSSLRRSRATILSNRCTGTSQLRCRRNPRRSAKYLWKLALSVVRFLPPSDIADTRRFQIYPSVAGTQFCYLAPTLTALTQRSLGGFF
jgi:hypothetical protein